MIRLSDPLRQKWVEYKHFHDKYWTFTVPSHASKSRTISGFFFVDKSFVLRRYGFLLALSQ